MSTKRPTATDEDGTFDIVGHVQEAREVQGDPGVTRVMWVDMIHRTQQWGVVHEPFLEARHVAGRDVYVVASDGKFGDPPKGPKKDVRPPVVRLLPRRRS